MVALNTQLRTDSLKPCICTVWETWSRSLWSLWTAIDYLIDLKSKKTSTTWHVILTPCLDVSGSRGLCVGQLCAAIGLVGAEQVRMPSAAFFFCGH